MKTIVKFLKVCILTIVTGGLYGAYWIFTNITRVDENPDEGEIEKSNLKVRNFNCILKKREKVGKKKNTLRLRVLYVKFNTFS